MIIIKTITQTVPNNKEGEEYLEHWLKSNEDDEYSVIKWFEDESIHGLTMSKTIWLEGDVEKE